MWLTINDILSTKIKFYKSGLIFYRKVVVGNQIYVIVKLIYIVTIGQYIISEEQYSLKKEITLEAILLSYKKVIDEINRVSKINKHNGTTKKD